MVKGLDVNLLRQTKANIANQQSKEIERAYDASSNGVGDSKTQNMIKSFWAQSIHQNVTKHFATKQSAENGEEERMKNINFKFCQGMIYKFEADESSASVPTEVMRSQIGYGLVLDHFGEFEQDNMAKKVCNGYTAKHVIRQIGKAMDDYHKNGRKLNKKKRKFSQMEMEESVVNEVEDFDIFEDVGRDYVCDPDETMNDPKRRRVSFMTPRLEQIEKMKNSEIKMKKSSLIEKKKK